MSEFVSPFTEEQIKENEKRLRKALASVDLEMSEDVIRSSQLEAEAMIKRLSTGETTNKEEEERLLNILRAFEK